MARIALPASHSFPVLGATGRQTRLSAPSAIAIGWISMALLFATAALSVYLVQISAVASAGYDLQRLEAERKGWLARNEQLELEVAKRRSLVWVESQALRLGMVRAEKPVYVQVISVQEEERDIDPSEIAARVTTRSQTSAAARADGRPARPEPGNPGWALDTVQAWLGLVATR